MTRVAVFAVMLTLGCDPAVAAENSASPGEPYPSEVATGNLVAPTFATQPPQTAELEYVAPQLADSLAPEPNLTIGADGLRVVPPPTFAPAPVFVPQTFSGEVDDDLVPRLRRLPDGLVFEPFLAGNHAPRLGAELVEDPNFGTLLDTSIGGQIALLRYGTGGPKPQGWELGTFGAAFARLAIDREMDVEATDYIFGIPIAYRDGGTAVRFGYAHLSSHTGDEFLLKNPGYPRINYVRDEWQTAIIQDLNEDFSVYAEAAYAFHVDGGAEPWAFQTGVQYAPPVVGGWHGAPVAVANLYMREEFDFDPDFQSILGWQWRGYRTNNLLRFGLTYYNGHSRQYSFFRQREQLTGVGLWYDFW